MALKLLQIVFGIENGDSVLGAEESGTIETAPLMKRRVEFE